MKTVLLIAALALAPVVNAEILDRQETRRTNYVMMNPDAAADFSFAKGAWPTNKVVIPGKGADSELTKFLLGTLKPQMPLRAPAWTPDKINLVKAWIDAGAQEAAFVKDIQPLFKQGCAGCHSPASHAGGLVLDTFASFQTSVVGH